MLQLGLTQTQVLMSMQTISFMDTDAPNPATGMPDTLLSSALVATERETYLNHAQQRGWALPVNMLLCI
jgi:hypothetical protein